jgi:release factor glutamine methyltransferase
VVSNPPYVAGDELVALAPEVRDWEPHTALVCGGHTEALVREATRVLRPGGALVLETHGEGAADVAALLSADRFTDVGVTPDLAGRDRVVEGRVYNREVVDYNRDLP